MVALRLICNINYRVEGKKNLPASEPFIIASKHQSMWETVYLMKILKKPVFILKKELTSIPFYGWYLKWMGMVSIKREDGLQSIKHIIIETKRAFSQGRSLIIFPEGTRIRPGENADIQPGIVAIQKSYPEIPIVPISLNSGNFWRKGEWLRYPGTVQVHIGEPIYGKQISKAEFLDKIKEEINKL